MSPSFITTRWSLVLAGAGQGSPEARDALAYLCEVYWYPLYSYVRRRGYDPDEAADLTQSFFVRLLDKNYLGDADPERGRFRSFLLTSLKHFLANEWDRVNAQKRVGDRLAISLDAEGAESLYRLEPTDDVTPEKLFEKRWAKTVLDRALARLEESYAGRGHGDQFHTLRPYLTGAEKNRSYGEVAEELEMTVGAVKVAVHRLRRRFGRQLRKEIAETVASEDRIDDEIRFLLGQES